MCDHDHNSLNGCVSRPELKLLSGFLLLGVVLWALSIPALANTGGSCGSDVTANQCEAGTGNPEDSAPDPASTETVRQAPAVVGNPINLITGNKYQKHSDYQSPASRLSWQRHYNSSNSAFDFGMGRGWAASFLAGLQFRNRQGAALVQGNGRRINFRAPVTVEAPDGTSRLIWQAFTASDGTLHVDGDYTVWSLQDGRQLTFKGQFLVNIDFPGPSSLKFYYVNNRIESVTDEYGSQLRFAYYPNHVTLPTYIDPDKETETAIDLNTFGAAPARLQRLILPNGQAVEYDYDMRGNLTRVRYPDSTERIYYYENSDYPSHLTGMTDRQGQRLATWDYNDEGYATLSEHADGVERVDLDYNHPTHIGGIGTTTVTNSLGEQSTYTWQRHHDAGHALILTAEGAGCATCSPTGYHYTYNEEYQLTDATRIDGSGMRWEYDTQGRTTATYRIGTDGTERLIQELVYAEGSDSALVNTNNARPIAMRYPSVSSNSGDRHEVLIDYSEEGLPVQITERGFSPTVQVNVVSDNAHRIQEPPSVISYEPIERSTSFEYENGRIARIDGPRTDVEDTVIFRYASPESEAGHLAEVVLPGGQRLYLSNYNVDGQPTQIRHNTSSPFQLTYDDNRRLIAINHRGNTQQFHYDADGRAVGITDADGRHNSVGYDAAGRMNRVTDDIGRELHWVHDSESRLSGERTLGFNGEEIRNLKLFYDTLGQLTSRTEERTNYSTATPVSHSTEFTHDVASRLIAASATDTDRQVDYNWNPFGELLAISTPFTEVTDAGYNETRSNSGFSYDSKGRLTSVTDARNNTTTYILDDFGRRVAEHNPDTGTTRFERDSAGNTVSKTTAAGDTTNYTYDAGNRVLTKGSRDGIATFTYHPVNGRLAETTNSSTTETYGYNNEGQLTTHNRSIDGNTFTTTYDYDERGRISDKGLPDGTRLRYHYYPAAQAGGQTSNAGQLRAITKSSWLGLVQETLVGEIDQDARDGLTRHINHNGSVTEKHFHPDGILKSINVSDGLQLAYKFDDHGKITVIDNEGTLARYTYTNGHLTQAKTSQGNYSYRYDSLGNRTHESIIQTNGELTQQNYSYPEPGDGNRLLSINDRAYKYHSDGALNETDQYRYVYNTERRPIQVFDGDRLLAAYGYNSFGERVKKVVYAESGNRVTYYLYDGHQLSAEITTTEVNSTPAKYRQTLYLGNAPVIYLDGGEIYSVQSDHLGAPHRLTDSNRQTVWAAEYTPFGAADISIDRITFGHRYPGQYFDEETETHYNYLRDYDPKTGRYITSDPIGLSGGFNRFAYANASPQNYSDAMGLQANPALGACVAGPNPVCAVGAGTTGAALLGTAIGVGIGHLLNSDDDEKQELLGIRVFRKDIDLFDSNGTGDKYGHWWIEIDGVESYGWWPEGPVSLGGTLTGVPGSLNAQTNEAWGGTPTRDPHHGDRGPGVNEFKVFSNIPKPQALSIIRGFAGNYSGQWSWPLGQNCHSFQNELLDLLDADIEQVDDGT